MPKKRVPARPKPATLNYIDEEMFRASNVRTRKLKSMARHFGRIDSIFAEKRVKVSIVNDYGNKSPGWTSGHNISLNSIYLPAMDTDKDMVVLAGLNYHELAHVLYTPDPVELSYLDYGDGSLYDLVWGVDNAGKYHNAWNILEDQRIEALITTRYLSTRHYLKETIYKYNLGHGDPGALASAFPYIHGRRYVPQAIRKGVWDLSPIPLKVRGEMADIINEYRTLNTYDRDDSRRAVPLVRRFAELMAENGADDSHGCGQSKDGRGGNGEQKGAPRGMKSLTKRVANGEADSGQSQSTEEAMSSKGASKPSKGNAKGTKDGKGTNDTKDKAKDDNDDPEGREEDGAEEQTPSGNSDQDASSEKSEDEDGGTDGEGNDDESDESSDADAGDDAEDNDDELDADGLDDWTDDDSDDYDDGDEHEGGDTGDGGGAGAGTGGVPEFTERELTSMIEDDSANGLRDPVIRSEVRSWNVSLRERVTIDRDAERPRMRNATDSEIGPLTGYARRTTNALRRIEADNDPAWEQSNTGKLNIGRAMRGQADPWDSWREGGNQASDLEVVLLLDVSSSMAGTEDELARAAYTLKQAGQTLGMPLTVVAFNHEQAIIYAGYDRIGINQLPGVTCTGGTKPSQALHTAICVFADSKKRHKVLVVMTDGDWGGSGYIRVGSNSYTNDGAIELMNRAGVLTCLLQLGDDATNQSHNAQIVQPITSVADIPPFVEGVLVKTLKRRER